jgi:hypothetical protein
MWIYWGGDDPIKCNYAKLFVFFNLLLYSLEANNFNGFINSNL